MVNDQGGRGRFIEENKDIVRRYQDVHNSNRLDKLDEIVAGDLIGHAPTYPGLPNGLARAKQAHRLNLSFFPDFQIRIEDLIGEGDKVAMRFTASGTHTGEPLFGVPASGKRFEIAGISIFRISDGKIVEHWANEDELSMLQQLGVLSVLG